MLISVALILPIAYLLGSIPFGVVLAKLLGMADPRTIGSGNIGATNMLRSGRKGVALATLLLDAGKGAAAVLIADQSADASTSFGALALLAATLGHMFPVWLKFKGGKGVATILGALLALSWPVAIFWCCVWLLVFLFTRYVSLASIVAMALLPLAALLRLDPLSAALLGLAGGIAIAKHHSNIRRLRQGLEPKMGKK